MRQNGYLWSKELRFHFQAYRKAQEVKYGKGHNDPLKMEKYHLDPSPSPSTESPLPLIQPRHRNKVTYVQRWKVLRDRNKNLPKLDFNAKASGIPKVKYDYITSIIIITTMMIHIRKVNPFPNKPLFLRVCSTRLENTGGKREIVLNEHFFSFFYSGFCHFHQF